MGQTYRQTDRQTDRHTDIFFIVVLGLGEVNKHAKKILGRSEKKNIRKSLQIVECKIGFGPLSNAHAFLFPLQVAMEGAASGGNAAKVAPLPRSKGRATTAPHNCHPHPGALARLSGGFRTELNPNITF